MSIIKSVKQNYGTKSQKDFFTIDNKKINDEIKSVISMNENLQKQNDFQIYKKKHLRQQSQQLSTGYDTQQNFFDQKKKMNTIRKNRQTKEIFKNSTYQKKIDDKLTKNNLIQLKMQQLYQYPKTTQNQQELTQEQIFQQLINEEMSLSNRLPNKKELEILKKRFSEYNWKKILQQLNDQKCPQNNQDIEERKQKIQQYNQYYIDLHYLKSTQHEQKIMEFFQSHHDYLSHISGQCKCYTCTCTNQCKCGFKQLVIFFKQKLRTVYESDFLDHKLALQQNDLDKHINDKIQSQRDNFQSNNKLSNELFKSINQIDYKENTIESINPRFNHKPYQSQQDVNYLTNNQIQFIKKGAQNLPPFDSQKKPTVLKEMKFFGQSSYKNDFCKTQQSSQESEMNFLVCKLSTIPLKYQIQFNIETQNQASYRNQKSNSQKEQVFIPPQNLQCLKSNNNYFKSQNQRTYIPQDVKYC